MINPRLEKKPRLQEPICSICLFTNLFFCSVTFDLAKKMAPKKLLRLLKRKPKLPLMKRKFPLKFLVKRLKSTLLAMKKRRNFGVNFRADNSTRIGTIIISGKVSQMRVFVFPVLMWHFLQGARSDSTTTMVDGRTRLSRRVATEQAYTAWSNIWFLRTEFGTFVLLSWSEYYQVELFSITYYIAFILFNI